MKVAEVKVGHGKSVSNL